MRQCSSLAVTATAGILAATINEAIVGVNFAIAGGVAAAIALAAISFPAGALAEQAPTSKKKQAAFEPIPVSWDLSSFQTPTQQLPWDSKRPETRSPWVGSYLGTLTPNNFAPPEGSAVAVPGLTDQVALGDYLFRFDAGRSYNDAASAVTDVGQSADSPDFRPLVKSKTSKRSLAAPYVGFTLTAPGSPFEPQTR